MQGEEKNSRRGWEGGAEEVVDSDRASLERYCLSWFVLTIGRHLGQVAESRW